jgi:hypothetical protein
MNTPNDCDLNLFPDVKCTRILCFDLERGGLCALFVMTPRGSSEIASNMRGPLRVQMNQRWLLIEC